MATFKQFENKLLSLIKTKNKEISIVKELDAMLEDSGFCVVYQASDGWCLMDIESSDIYMLNDTNINKALKGQRDMEGGI